MLNQPPLLAMLERNPMRSRYTLVAVAAKRARQLLEGAPPLADAHSTKPVTIALHEVYEEKLACDLPRGGIK